MKKLLNKMTRLAAFAMIVAAAGIAAENTIAAEVNGIVVEDPFARARPGSAKMGGAFLKITNTNASDDALVSARTDVAKRTELHTHMMQDGVMRMSQVDMIPLLAGKTVMLKPGGYHVMMMGLTSALEKGSDFKLTLSFRHAGDITVMVPVKDAGAMGVMKHKMKNSE